MTKRAIPVALGLVALAVASGVSAARADAPTRTVTMPGKAYDPTHLDVLVGTTVTWKNEDSINHTVTADGDAFSSGYVPPGGSFAFTFAQQGRYAFHCTIHKFMRGEVDVFGLVLTGPEGAVGAGQRVVFAGLAPAGTSSVAVRGPHGDVVVKPRADGSFAVRTPIGEPGSYRAVAGGLVSPAVAVRGHGVVDRVVVLPGDAGADQHRQLRRVVELPGHRHGPRRRVGRSGGRHEHEGRRHGHEGGEAARHRLTR